MLQRYLESTDRLMKRLKLDYEISVTDNDLLLAEAIKREMILIIRRVQLRTQMKGKGNDVISRKIKN